MTIYNRVIIACWIVFVLYWAISAIGTKRNIGPGAWRREGGWRVGIIVVVVLALRIAAVRHALRDVQTFAAGLGALAGVAGVILCGLGMGLAVWARIHLGRNWGTPMSRKENPELVTSGPYAFVRHPIYGGLLVAMLGSALCESLVWLLPFVVSVPYFIYSARNEERLMCEQFPEQYPAYMRRTRMLLPFVF